MIEYKKDKHFLDILALQAGTNKQYAPRNKTAGPDGVDQIHGKEHRHGDTSGGATFLTGIGAGSSPVKP